MIGLTGLQGLILVKPMSHADALFATTITFLEKV